MLPVAKRILREVVKVVAVSAGVVFLFDNQLSGTAGLVLLGSGAVLLLCLLIWLIFDLSDTGFWPDQPDKSNLWPENTGEGINSRTPERSQADEDEVRRSTKP